MCRRPDGISFSVRQAPPLCNPLAYPFQLYPAQCSSPGCRRVQALCKGLRKPDNACFGGGIMYSHEALPYPIRRICLLSCPFCFYHMFGCALTAVEHPPKLISVTVRQSSCVMSVKALSGNPALFTITSRRQTPQRKTKPCHPLAVF